MYPRLGLYDVFLIRPEFWGFGKKAIVVKCPFHGMIMFFFVIILIVLSITNMAGLLVDLRARLLTFHSYLRGNPLSQVLVRDFPEDSWWKIGKGKEKKVTWHMTEHELMKILTNISVPLSSTGRSANVASTCPGSLWNPPTPKHLYPRSPLPPLLHTHQASFLFISIPTIWFIKDPFEDSSAQKSLRESI